MREEVFGGGRGGCLCLTEGADLTLGSCIEAFSLDSLKEERAEEEVEDVCSGIRGECLTSSPIIDVFPFDVKSSLEREEFEAEF